MKSRRRICGGFLISFTICFLLIISYYHGFNWNTRKRPRIPLDWASQFLKRPDPGSRKRNLAFYRINTVVSDRIGERRIFPDGRPTSCRQIRYPTRLPQTSVVIVFRDEWPSVVLRMIYSLLHNTQPALLKEVVLVDDGSLKDTVRARITQRFGNVPKIKLLVNPSPLGLMMARQRGIESTTSRYFVVMDAHLEFNWGWLQPLIARLVAKPQNLLSSHVGRINPSTFNATFPKEHDRVFIAYDPLTFKEIWTPYNDTFRKGRNGSVEPIPTAAVQGMSIAMKKDFFFKLGGFDPGMKQWGSEQFELSLKVWMCGGAVEKIPCSKVSHLYRITPWGKVNNTANFLVANSIRASEVWLDEPYKNLINEVIGQHSKYDIGDLTDRHRIRKENNCKPFQYFVDTVKTFSDVYLLDKIKAKGFVRNMVVDTCLAVEKTPEKTYKLKMSKCNNGSKEYFVLTEQNQIRSIQACMLKTNPKQNKNDSSIAVEIIRSVAYNYKKDAVWLYRDDNSIFHESTKKCLTLKDKSSFTVEQCDGRLEQEWSWQRVVYT